MRFASLGSGSRGNALVVEAGSSRLLLDCGFGARDTERRLARLGLSPDDLSGVLVTHEHSDHIGGVFRLAVRHRLKIWLTRGTLSSLQSVDAAAAQMELIVGDTPFAVDGIDVLPYSVPHDAREPVQFVFSDGHSRLGVLTDAGCATRHIEHCLNGCDALVLECNHDAEMLAAGAYPPSLKARIAGCFGHLDNASAAALLAALDPRPLKHVIAAHLSEKNNRPELARRALADALDCAPEWIGLALQDEGFAWRDLR